MMNFDEYIDRQKKIHKAMGMFPDETNITVALQKYKEATGDDIPLFITTKDANRPLTPFDDYERIKCEECGADMMFRLCPENEEGIKTQLVCSNKDCDNVLNSEYSLQEWMGVLKKK